MSLAIDLMVVAFFGVAIGYLVYRLVVVDRVEDPCQKSMEYTAATSLGGFTIGLEVGRVEPFNEQLSGSFFGAHFWVTEEGTDTVIYEEIVDLCEGCTR